MGTDNLVKCNTEKPYVFISYSSLDSDVVWADVQEFQKRGYNVWLDEKNLDKTKPSWKEDAMKAIEDIDCQLVVFYVSRNSLTSQPCFNEMLTTKSEDAKDFHEGAPVPFIAVDVEPIGNIIDFKNRIFKEIKESETLEKPDKMSKIKVMSEFIKEFFNSNNERVRIHDRTDESYTSRYYQEITNYFSEETRSVVVETVAEESAEAVEAPVQAQVSELAEEQLEVQMAEKQETETATQDMIRTEGHVGVPATDIAHDDSSHTETAHTGTMDEGTSKKVFTTTGDITYTLYGETHTENQSDMMLRFFAQVLKRHQEIVDELLEYKGMNCVSKVDYTDAANRTEEMPSYFRVCRYFKYENGSAICVGTAYSAADKLKKMALLLQIVGEDLSVFSSEQVELPAMKVKAEKGITVRGGNTADMSFKVFGEAFEATQVDMLGIVFSKLIEKHSGLLEEIAEGCTCVDIIDYSTVDKEARPCYFKSSFNVYEVNGVKYSVGGGFSLKEKLRLISKLMNICGENADSVQIEGEELTVSKPSKAGRKSKEDKQFL